MRLGAVAAAARLASSEMPRVRSMVSASGRKLMVRVADSSDKPGSLPATRADGSRNSAGSIRESVSRLKMLSAEGKPVFVVEYPRNEQQAETARREISDQGFIGLIARRSLSAL